MVLKLAMLSFYGLTRFENDVKMYGTQTVIVIVSPTFEFENDVKMYGTQTFFTLQSDPSIV